MKTYIALLRGINVGGNNILPMKELIKLMETNGFSNVKTYIQSGNVVFQSKDDPEGKIGNIIEQNYGFNPQVFILSLDELEVAIRNNPFPTDVGKAVHFCFLDQTPLEVDYPFLETLKKESEEYKLIDKVLYIYAPEGIGRSKLAAKMGKAFKGVTMTARNLNTVNKLINMVV